MIIATELGKDPLLRQAIRDTFKTDALISVTPTERGIAKIDEHNQYYVSLSDGPVESGSDSIVELQIPLQ